MRAAESRTQGLAHTSKHSTAELHPSPNRRFLVELVSSSLSQFLSTKLYKYFCNTSKINKEVFSLSNKKLISTRKLNFIKLPESKNILGHKYNPDSTN